MPLKSTLECWVRLALFRCARALLHHPRHQDARSQFLADLHDPANAGRPFFLRRYRRSARSKAPDALVLPGTWRFAEMLWCSYGIEAPGLVLGAVAAAGVLLLLARTLLAFTRFLLYPNDVVAEHVASGRGTTHLWVLGALMFVVPLAAIVTVQLRKMLGEPRSVHDACKYLQEQEAARQQALAMANLFISLSLFFGNFFIRLIFYRFWDPGHDFFFDVVASILSIAWCAVVALDSLHAGPSRLTTIFLTFSNLLHVPLTCVLRGLRSVCVARALVTAVGAASALAALALAATGLVPALVCHACFVHADAVKRLEVALAARAFRAVLSAAPYTPRPLPVRARAIAPAATGLVARLPGAPLLTRNVCLSVRCGTAPARHQPMATYGRATDCFAFPPVVLPPDAAAALAAGTPCQLLLSLRDKPTGLVVSEVLYNLTVEGDGGGDGGHGGSDNGGGDDNNKNDDSLRC